MHSEHMQKAISAAMSLEDRVAVFTTSAEESRALVREFEQAAPVERIARISRVNGRCFIEFHGGGWIRFIATTQSARGMSLDRAYVPIGTKPDRLADLLPCLQTSTAGVLTGY